VAHLASWLIRAGAFLGIAAFFVPRLEPSPGKGLESSLSALLWLAETTDHEVFFIYAAGLLAPLAACLLLMDGTGGRNGASPLLRWVVLLFFLAWAFSLATMGSLVATLPSATGGDETAATLLLFAAPLVLATIVIARVLGGSNPVSTGTIARGSIGLLLFLESIYDFRSPLNSGWGAGALLPILAGALIVAGATLALARPERAAAVPVAAAAEKA